MGENDIVQGYKIEIKKELGILLTVIWHRGGNCRGGRKGKKNKSRIQIRESARTRQPRRIFPKNGEEGSIVFHMKKKKKGQQ